jgi:hypothetical protein
VLVTLGLLGCAPEAPEAPADEPSAFRGYGASQGIVYKHMELWRNLIAAQPPAIRDEMAALHFGAALFAISKQRWSEEVQHREITDVRDQLARDMAPGSDRTEAAWRGFLDERGPAYAAQVPEGFDPFTVLTDEEMRAMGAVLVDAVEARSDVPAERPLQPKDWELSAGDYFRWRLIQIMRGLEGVP